MWVDFYYRQTHSYKEYIEQQYLKQNIDIVLAKNVREAVGTIDDIYERNAAGLEEIGYRLDRTNENLEHISLELGGISEQLDVINDNLVNGFQAIFVELHEINDSLAHIRRDMELLVEIARTPVQTWAINQYENARDATRRKLFPEALEALDLAINGNGQQVGYKTDFRFHLLRGVLLLGVPGEPETASLIDLEEAERSFLLAARYARHDNKTEAAQAFVGAGKAVYAKGDLIKAQRHHRAALAIDPRCGEANYQLARLSAEANAPDLVEQFLGTAFDIHWSFAIRAAADAQFAHHTALVEKCAHAVAAHMSRITSLVVGKLQRKLHVYEQNQDEVYTLDSWSGYQDIKTQLETLDRDTKSGLLKNAFEARLQISTVPDKVKYVVSGYCDKLSAREGEISSRRVTSEKRADPQTVGISMGVIVFVVGVVAWFIYALNETSAMPNPILNFLVIFIGMGIFVGIGLLFLVLVVGWGSAAIAGISGAVGEHAERRHNDATIAKNREVLKERLIEIRSALDF